MGGPPRPRSAARSAGAPAQPIGQCLVPIGCDDGCSGRKRTENGLESRSVASDVEKHEYRRALEF